MEQAKEKFDNFDNELHKANEAGHEDIRTGWKTNTHSSSEYTNAPIYEEEDILPEESKYLKGWEPHLQSSK